MHLPLITLNLIQCRLKWLLWVHFQLSIISGNIDTFAHQPSTASLTCPYLVIKKIVRMLFSSFVWLMILADGKISKYWFRKSLPRSIYSISILLLEFIFPFVRPSEYIIIPEVCAQGWYSSSTPVLFVEFGSFFLTFFSYFPHISAPFWRIYDFLSNLRTFLLNLRTFLSIFSQQTVTRFL